MHAADIAACAGLGAHRSTGPCRLPASTCPSKLEQDRTGVAAAARQTAQVLAKSGPSTAPVPRSRHRRP